MFTDVLFNGKTKYEERDVDSYVYSPDKEQIDSLLVILYSLSDDLYKFLISYKSYDNTRGAIIYDQPSLIYSNIRNGYGVFGSYSVDTVFFKLSKK